MRPGLRREVAVLLPLALLVLVAIAVFTLFAYRGAIDLLLAERGVEAERLARSAAEALAERPDSPASELRRRLPLAAGLELLDASGGTLAVSGETLPLSLDVARYLDVPFAIGPSDQLPGTIAAFAAVPGNLTARFVRVDLSVGALAARRESLRILLPVVLGATVAMTLLVLLFLRHLFAPFDSLLERARAAGALGPSGDGRDEIEDLVHTFERALVALERPDPASPSTEDDLAALERALAPSLSSGLLLLDRDGAVLGLNSAGSAILDIKTPVPGTPLAEALDPHPEFAGLLAGAIAADLGLERSEIAIATPSGPRTLGLTLHPLRRDDGVVRGQLVFFADLTEARRAEEESRLERSLAQLGELAAGVAHELRNSLATLNGYLALIARRPGEETIADYLVEIRRESGHLERVVEDFLAFARPGSARLENVDVETLVRRAACDPALSGAAITIRRADTSALEVHADPHLLERALRNLLHNAVQAAAQAAAPAAERAASQAPAPAVARASGHRAEPVEVLLSATPGWVEVAICDRGAGLPPEVRERLFEPFSAGRPGGVGLGLALSHRIVALHGGGLRLEERQGGGTRAVLALPAPSRDAVSGVGS